MVPQRRLEEHVLRLISALGPSDLLQQRKDHKRTKQKQQATQKPTTAGPYSITDTTEEGVKGKFLPLVSRKEGGAFRGSSTNKQINELIN